LQFQTTTKNEIGNPFGEVYLIFFILGYFATAPIFCREEFVDRVDKQGEL